MQFAGGRSTDTAADNIAHKAAGPSIGVFVTKTVDTVSMPFMHCSNNVVLICCQDRDGTVKPLDVSVSRTRYR